MIFELGNSLSLRGCGRGASYRNPSNCGFVRSRLGRVGIAGISLVVFGLYVHAILGIWRADWLRDEHDRPSLEASARLEPWDAQTHWLLGRYFLYAAVDPPNALLAFRRAVKLNRYDARYWLDLAAAYELGSDSGQSKKALEQALRAEPTSTEIVWNTANFYLTQNDTSRALPLFRVVLEYDPRNTAAALDLCWRATKNVTQIVTHTLPAQPASYFVLLKILTAQSQSAPANELWHALIAQKLKFSVEEAFPYFDYLIQTQQIDQAKQVWADLRKLDSALQDDSPSNLVRNGGFEAEALNGGFDWRSGQTSQIHVSLDTSESHSGTRALRIAFIGPGVSDSGVYEYVPVQPNTRYRFSAFVKTQDIITASGPRLSVQDLSTGKMATTDEFLGTSAWGQRTAEFVTGPETHLVTLRMVRIPGNPLIKGTFWLDDVELTPASAAPRAIP